MRFLMIVGLLALLLNFETCALDPPSKLTDLFEIQPGSEDDGGCDGLEDMLQGFFQEAIWMAKAAKNAIQYLRNPSTQGLSPEQRNAKNNLYRFYSTEAQINFGVYLVPEIGYVIPQNPQATGPLRYGTWVQLERALAVYNKILQFVDMGSPPVRKYISCGNNAVAVVGPDEKDPRASIRYNWDTNNPEWPTLNANGEFPNGALWWEYGRMITHRDPNDPYGATNQWCKPGDQGVTVYNWGLLNLCEDVIDRADRIPNSQELAGRIPSGRSQIHHWNLAPERILLHEMCHLWDLEVHDNAMYDENFPLRNWGEKPPIIQGVAGVGATQVMYVAANSPEWAPLSPESLAQFALEVWLWDFKGEGYGWDFTTRVGHHRGNWPS